LKESEREKNTPICSTSNPVTYTFYRITGHQCDLGLIQRSALLDGFLFSIWCFYSHVPLLWVAYFVRINDRVGLHPALLASHL
jgi:hypothetical protein